MDFKTEFIVEPGRYAGLWYEHARSPNDFEDNTPRRDGQTLSICYRATAQYTIMGSDKIRLINRCTRYSGVGQPVQDEARGIAHIRKGSDGRKLKIAFGPWFARLVQRTISWGGFPYWIYCLGPTNSEGLYDWAVVSGPDKSFIFILTRDRFVSDQTRNDIFKCAREESLPLDNLVYSQIQQSPAD